MASRLGLSRIIEWAKNADLEEVKYTLQRLMQIAEDRNQQVERAGAPIARKARKRRTKAEIDGDRADTQIHEDAKAAQGVHG